NQPSVITTFTQNSSTRETRLTKVKGACFQLVSIIHVTRLARGDWSRLQLVTFSNERSPTPTTCRRQYKGQFSPFFFMITIPLGPSGHFSAKVVWDLFADAPPPNDVKDGGGGNDYDYVPLNYCP
ncbi:hypothetical protein BaRGS_00036513, partial [Batillaria attramentaria]